MITTTLLSPEEGRQAIELVRRFHELSKTTIVSPAIDAEREGIKKHIANLALQYADELLACWSAVRFEYEPFVGAVSLVMDRISSIRRNRQLASQLPVVPPEAENNPNRTSADEEGKILTLPATAKS